MKSRESDLLKLETVKSISTPVKINAILLNIMINKPKLVGNKLAKFRESTLSLSKIFQKALGGRVGLFF